MKEESERKKAGRGKKLLVCFSREKRVALLAGDLGVLTASVPLFSLRQRDRNLFGSRLWRDERGGVETVGQTGRNTRENERNKTGKKRLESERDKRNRWATVGETRPSENLHQDQTPREGRTVQQQCRRACSKHWTTSRHAPGGSEWPSCHRVHITSLAARDTAALVTTRAKRRGLLSAGGEQRDLSSRRCQRWQTPGELLTL